MVRMTNEMVRNDRKAMQAAGMHAQKAPRRLLEEMRIKMGLVAVVDCVVWAAVVEDQKQARKGGAA